MAGAEPGDLTRPDLLAELEAIILDLVRLRDYLEALVAARAPERRN
jgi:hypothetical protein